MGVANGFKSVKLNLVRIESMYDSCDKEMVRASMSLVILIPSNHLAGPDHENSRLWYNRQRDKREQ